MRKLAVALVGCALLTGCAANWQAEVRYKIVSIDKSTPTEMFKLELVGDAPKGVLETNSLSPQYELLSEVSGGAAVGDEVVCTAKQKKGSAIEDSNVVTDLIGCKKA